MKLEERFLKYVSYPTMSDESSDTVPSTAKQLVLSRAIAEELRALGLSDVELDEYGYLYATLPANVDDSTVTLGLVAHVDTSDACPDQPIKPRIVEYCGGDICLNEERGIVMSPADYPSLNGYVGDHLIVTDGTTLLGADDKAGVCAIVSAIERLISSGEKHGRVRICFTPDEEIGRGADHFNVEKFGADYAYTVDGGALGEIEYENFNAASAKFTIHGVNTHPGSAKNKMKNAALYAAELVAMLPAAETPSHTEGREGFYHVSDIVANESEAHVSMIIRDHDRAEFERRKEFVRSIEKYLASKYGEGSVVLEMNDSYYNMKEIIDEHLDIVERAEHAMRLASVEPVIVPIRGGTDGARLSFEGLPCPNLSTGGLNFHSRYEAVPTASLVKMTDVLVNLVCDR